MAPTASRPGAAAAVVAGVAAGAEDARRPRMSRRPSRAMAPATGKAQRSDGRSSTTCRSLASPTWASQAASASTHSRKPILRPWRSWAWSPRRASTARRPKRHRRSPSRRPPRRAAPHEVAAAHAHRLQARNRPPLKLPARTVRWKLRARTVPRKARRQRGDRGPAHGLQPNAGRPRMPHRLRRLGARRDRARVPRDGLSRQLTKERMLPPQQPAGPLPPAGVPAVVRGPGARGPRPVAR